MLTAGVDLAAEPSGTALAVIEWTVDGANLTQLERGVTDAPIVEVAKKVSKIGIDCALGWPREFVEFMVEYGGEQAPSRDVDGGMDWRRRLAYRQTDRHVREVTGRWPLSVSTDRLGLTALRCAGLLTRMLAAGIHVDRSGAGAVVEVYPGASLRRWGLDTSGYRTDTGSRERLLCALEVAAPWLHLAGFRPLIIESGDAFDAVIAALAARASWLGLCEAPPPEYAALARHEGWIALPDGALDALLAETNGRAHG